MNGTQQDKWAEPVISMIGTRKRRPGTYLAGDMGPAMQQYRWAKPVIWLAILMIGLPAGYMGPAVNIDKWNNIMLGTWAEPVISTNSIQRNT